MKSMVFKGGCDEVRKKNVAEENRTAIDSLNELYYIMQTSERCQSGRMGRSRNPESVTGPRVRIPLSP